MSGQNVRLLIQIFDDFTVVRVAIQHTCTYGLASHVSIEN